MKLTKRLLSMLLVLCMVFSMLPAMGLTASAASVKWKEVAWNDITTDDTFIITITNSNGTYLMNSANGTSATPKLGYTGTITTENSVNYCTFDEVAEVLWKRDSSNRLCVASDTGKWIYTNSSNNALRVGTNTTGNTWTQDGDYIKSNNSRYLSIYSTTDFRSYTTKQSGQVTRFFKAETASSFTVTASASPAAGGTVTVDGNTITATPNDGYYVTGDFVADDGIEVTYHNDNTFTFSATADGEVLIEFAAKTAATLTYSENGATHNAAGTYYVGDSVTLADPVNAAPATYTFMGWLPSTYATNDTAPANLLKVGDSYTLSAADNTLYAVYAIAGEGGSGDGSTFKKVTAEKSDWSGTYVIADKNAAYVLDYATSSTAGNATTIASSGITLTDDVMTNVAEQYTVTLGKTGDNYYVQLNGATDAYLALTANSNTVSRGSSYSATSGQWTVTWDTDGVHLFSVNYNTRELQKNSSNAYFRCYTGTQTDIVLYEQQGGTSYTGYTTTVNTEATYYTLTYSANPADGGSITCDSTSGASIEEGELVELTAVAAEHYTFSDWTVTGIGADDYTATGNSLLVTMSNDVTVVANFTAEATYTVTVNQATGGTMEASKASGIFAGETITLTATPDAHYSFGGWQVVSGGASITGDSFTMPASNVVITGSFVEDAKYTVTYYDKDGHVCATKTYYDGETILASDVPSVEAPDGFAFKDWYSTTYNGTDAPAYTTPAGTTVNGNLEFHAVYAELGEGGSETFKLLVDGKYVATRSGSNSYLGTATTEADAVEMGYDAVDGKAYLYYLEGTTKVYIYNTSSDTSIAFSSGSIPTGTTGYEYWTVTESDGTITFKNGTGTRYLALNSDRFSTYTPTQNQYPYQFTKIGGASISGYTTNPVSTKITVTWMNGTDIFKTEKVAYGDAIVAPDTNPEKTEEEQQYFTFAGWSEDGSTVITTFPTASAELGDKTYYAVYTTVSKLTVTWNNYDGTTLATEYYKAGETPSYKGSEPTKPADSSFYYTFSGWDPTVSSITSSITYTATFTQHDRFELTASLSKDTVKVDRFAQVNYTLTDMGTETTAFTPTFSVGNDAIASVDANGKIKALSVGSTTVTITFDGVLDAEGNPISKTLNLTVIENTASGGYTLITQDNAPTDWSGDYIIMGKPAGDTTYMNTWMILTPDYDTGTAKIATNNEDAATITITDDGSGIGTGTINDEGNASSGVDKTIVMEDTGLVTDTNDDDSILVYDTITEIDDAYAFTIECIDDINQIYTIRVKDTDLYIACSSNTSTGSNSLNFDSSATKYAQWKFSVQRVTKGGYNNDIITAQNVGNTTRRLYFNSNQYGAIDGQFRDYHSDAYGSMIGGNANGRGQAYNLYLFGNPNPFKAQIYYHGDQITLVDTGKINANAATAQLVGALTPDIDGYPNWTLVGDPEWAIVENSTGNNMTVNAATGLITTNASTVGSYALVKVTYTIHDEINNVNQLVSTTAKVEVIDADTTYSTVIYETYSGTDTEVQYTVPNSMTTLPLAAYVVNDTTDDNSKTGSVVMGGTLTWKAVISSGGGTNANVSIDSDGTLHMENFASDAIITVTVSGATGDSIAASSATYKVYVKTAEYTLTVVSTIDSQGKYDEANDVLTVASGESSAHLTYTVVDGDGKGPGSTTFTLAGYAWTLSGDTYGAMINSSGLLDFTGMDRSEDRTITAVVSRVAATDVVTGVTKSNLTDTITIVVKAQTVEEVLEAVNDTVIIDWALPVTFNVLTNDNYNVTVSVTAGTLPTGVSANGDGTFTYTPSGWQTTDQTFTYTLSGTVNGVATSSEATVTLKTADSIYYEDTYSGIFTFSGNWVDVTNGTLVAAQTSSLDTADAFEYDANHTKYAMYSGGTAKMTTLVKGDKPSVTFSFAGTGFDIISATTNNTGAIMLTVKDAGGAVVTDPNTGKKLSQIIDIFRGYTYVEDGYTRYGLKEVTRYKLEGESYIPDAAGNYYYDSELKQFVENTVWYTPAENMSDKYYDSANQFDSMQDENGTYVLKEYTSNWQPSTGENSDGNYYQIPILKVTDLPYGTYTVTVKPVYSAAYDRQGDGSYDFIFDGVRIHNPVAGREAEYKYISLSDAVKEAGFGSGTVVACDHVGQEWSDWTFYSRARNTTSATTCNRGSFVQYCNYCGGVANTAYFHVNITADATELGVGGYNSLPSTTMLHYTLTADECGDAAVQASIQAKLDAINGTLTEYWSSNTRDIMTCMNNSNVVIANGSGTTYATLQLKDPATQTIYASAIHSPMITVYADETHTHTFGDWVHDADSDPSTHTHTCTAETCSYYETEACVFTSEVTTEPTQTTEGVRTYTCTGCSYSYTESIPALGGYTATFHVPEGATAPAAQTGDSATMPAAVEAPADYDAHSYTFVGWLGNSLSDTTAAQTYYEAGAVIPLSSDMEFYALYTYGAAGEDSGYSLSTTVPVDGDSIIVAALDGSTYKALSVSGSTVSASALTVSGSTITSATDGLTWTVADDTYSSYTGLSLSNDSGYLHMNSSALKTASDKTNGVFEFTAYGVGTFLMKGLANTRWLSYGTAFGVASAENDAAPIYIFKAASATTYFTTKLAKTCQHANTTTVTVDAACLTDGSVTVTCNDCGKTVSVTVLPALGHDYQVTSVDGNVTTYTCSRCGDSYTESTDYAVSYIMQEGVTYSGNSRDGNNITLPTAVSIPSTYNAQTYTLVGWATETSADSETAPTYYAPGEVVTIQDDAVFYPLYSFGGSGSGSSTDFVEFSGSIVEGDYLITYDNAAMKAALSSNRLSFTTVTPSNNVVSNPNADLIWHIAPSGSYVTIYNASSGNYAASNGSKNNAELSTDGADDKSLWTASGSSTYEFVNKYNSAYNINANLRKNGTYGFATYSSSTGGALTLYKAAGSGSGTTTYTFTLQAAELTDNYVVTVTPASLTMPFNSTASLTAVLTNNGTVVTAESIDFTSDNANIVVADTTGSLLSGSTAGTATITVDVLAPDGNIYSATCKITVAEQSTDVTVNYIGSRTGKVYNWGTRDTTATFLTAPAAAYYTGSYSYETLSTLPGNSGTDTGFYSSELGTAIHNMLVAKQTSTTSYSSTTSMYAYTDCVESDTAHISSYYSAKQVSSTWDSGATWNREHTWPNSKGLDGNDENDIMMLRPTSVSENSSRRNTAYGESSGYYDPNKYGQNLHGDVARLMLQHLMRWGNTSYFYGSGGVMESRAVLLKWLEEDPVDTWEMGRNDAVERITGVRNVFVDYPELAFILLGAEVPANYTTPSKSGVVAAATYSSTAGSGYVPVVSSTESKNAGTPAVRSIPTGDFTGAVIIDGMGQSNVAADFAAYGPNYGVYLAPGQGIVFSLASDVTNITTQDLQIGAKAVNGTATQMDVAAISNGIKYLLQDQAIASATEMYYELDGSQVGWSNGNSSIIVIYNSGSGVLDVTNIRYSTANGNTLTLTINDTQTKNAVKMLGIVYGTEITVADPNNVEPIDPTTESSAEPTTEPEPDPITIDRFTDIKKDAWYIDGVKYAIDNGLMNGVSMTEFAPEETLTRAMLVTILYRLAGEPETSTKTNFTDVPEGEWYSDAVAWTVEKGVTLGTSETTFDPSQPVTREQLVTFLWRYAGKPESKQSLSAFADNAMVSEYAYTAMQWAVENMIVNGKEDDKLDPVGNATRAEIAIIFMRAEKMLAQPE